jgi:hypothetical protein
VERELHLSILGTGLMGSRKTWKQWGQSFESVSKREQVRGDKERTIAEQLPFSQCLQVEKSENQQFDGLAWCNTVVAGARKEVPPANFDHKDEGR